MPPTRPRNRPRAVLHLLDATTAISRSPVSLASIADLIQPHPAPEHGPEHDPATTHHVLLIGGPREAEAARAAGLRVAQRLSLPGGDPWRGLALLRRTLGQTGLNRVDRVHAWSIRSAAAAVALMRPAPRVLTLVGPPRRPARWLMRRLLDPPPVGRTLLTVHDPAAAAGLDDLRPAPLPMALDPARLAGADRMDRGALRRRWGIAPGEEDRRTRVVALLSDPADQADAVHAVIAIGLATETTATLPAAEGARFRLLVRPAQHRRPRAQDLMTRFGRPDATIQEPWLTTPWSVLAGCDAALVPRGRGQGRAAAWAMAAGVPVIAEEPESSGTPLLDHLKHDHTAYLVPPNQPQAVSHALVRLCTEPELARRLSVAGRAWVRTRMSPALAQPAMDELYARAGSVDRPTPSPVA